MNEPNLARRLNKRLFGVLNEEGIAVGDLASDLPFMAGFPGLNPGDRWCLCAARWQ